MPNMTRIDVDGSITEIVGNSLEQMQKAVGGCIEAVHIADGAYMYCNESGKILGLAPNMTATKLYEEEFGAKDIIVGAVVLVGTINPQTGEEDGESYDAPSWLIEKAKALQNQ